MLDTVTIPNGHHFEGLLRMIPLHLVRTEDVLKRLIGRFIPKLTELAFRLRFQIQNVTKVELDELEREGNKLLDKNGEAPMC